MVAPTVRRAGDTSKSAPFTVLVVANVALETPYGSKTFVMDPILASPTTFASSVNYIDDALFGKLPHQAELLLGDPAIAPNVRLLTLFDTTLAVKDAHSFVGQHVSSSLLMARRGAVTAFLTSLGIIADVVFAVTSSPTHSRASAWFTTDDDTRPGNAFFVDSTTTYSHRHWYSIPGTIAIHSNATSLTASHEFGHAISSYTNGMIVDLYVDSPAALNCRVRHPPPPTIPPTFATYAPPFTTHLSDLTRTAAGGYPAGWNSYHCALIAPSKPALMDNYWAGVPPEACEHDGITRQFIRDRILAKMGR